MTEQELSRQRAKLFQARTMTLEVNLWLMNKAGDRSVMATKAGQAVASIDEALVVVDDNLAEVRNG